MNWIDFVGRFPRGVPFTPRQAGLFYPGIHLKSVRQNIFNWTRQGRLLKLRRDLYVVRSSGLDARYLANRIYEPSYISLEYALSRYGLIPEAAFGVTSVTVNKTARFETPVGLFSYRHLKRDYYFGYRLENGVLIAEREKSLIDYFYFHLEEVRFDRRYLDSLRLGNWEALNRKKLRGYLKRIPVKKLSDFIEFCYE